LSIFSLTSACNSIVVSWQYKDYIKLICISEAEKESCQIPNFIKLLIIVFLSSTLGQRKEHYKLFSKTSMLTMMNVYHTLIILFFSKSISEVKVNQYHWSQFQLLRMTWKKHMLIKMEMLTRRKWNKIFSDKNIRNMKKNKNKIKKDLENQILLHQAQKSYKQ